MLCRLYAFVSPFDEEKKVNQIKKGLWVYAIKIEYWQLVSLPHSAHVRTIFRCSRWRESTHSHWIKLRYTLRTATPALQGFCPWCFSTPISTYSCFIVWAAVRWDGPITLAAHILGKVGGTSDGGERSVAVTINCGGRKQSQVLNLAEGWREPESAGTCALTARLREQPRIVCIRRAAQLARAGRFRSRRM